jgi:ribosomal protein S13
MKSTGKEYNKLTLRSSCITTFRTLYGIGKVKAMKINSFLLNHPFQQKFKGDLQLTMNSAIGSNILARIPFGGKVRICVYLFMERKINTYCYKAHRLFQNLPTRGQRTRTNANTSRCRNPYQILEMNLKFFKGASITYKRLELLHNGRYDELKIFDRNIQDSFHKQKDIKTDFKFKKKKK